MGLEALFDEPKIKVEETEYEKGKNYCCDSVCSIIANQIELITDGIDDILSGGSLEDIKDKSDYNAIINHKTAIKVLTIVRRKIIKDKPYCRCR